MVSESLNHVIPASECALCEEDTRLGAAGRLRAINRSKVTAQKVIVLIKKGITLTRGCWSCEGENDAEAYAEIFLSYWEWGLLKVSE